MTTQAWLQGGQDALALVTASLVYADVSDPSHTADLTQVIADLDREQLSVVAVWLARFAASATLDVHGGSLSAAQSDIQRVAMSLAEITSRVAPEDSRG